MSRLVKGNPPDTSGPIDESDPEDTSQSPVKCCHAPFAAMDSLLTMTSNVSCGKTIHAFLDLKRRKKEEELATLEAAKIIDRQDGIKKQPNDPYKYRYIHLENGLRLILASNPKGNTSAAALDIKVGSFSDPIQLQGLCHLCEHVLFTGSEAFHNESYSNFLGQRGGSSNAYTASEHTNFHFDVPSQFFEEALHRFVSFFECPIFRETSVQSELEMVQSEHEKNRWNDLWRANQVERATANENHAFSRFSTGNRKTLSVDKHASHNLRYELFNFFKTNYSANLMTVCLVHSKPLEDMEELAKTYFLKIPNRNIPETIWPNRPFKASQMKTKIYVVPVKDVYHVNLTFPLDDLHQHFRSSPEGFCAQIIGYKGPKGLFSHLRKLGFAHHLVAGWKNLARGFSFFIITIQLTELGERYIDDTIKCVFQFIHMVKGIEPQKWFFDELQFLSEQQFANKDLERVQTYASNVANWLHIYPPTDCLVADYVFEEWNPDVIRFVLKFLVPDNLRVTVLSKKCRYFTTMVEPHFGTEYHVERIGEEVLNTWRKCGTNDLHDLPSPNNLIDKEMQLVPRDPKRESAMPELLIFHKRIHFLTWFLPSTSPQLPKSYLYFKFSHPTFVCRDARSSALISVFVALVRDALVEYSYQGELGGIFYTLKPFKTGIELGIRGYSAKQHIFLKSVMKVLYGLKLDPGRFEQVLEFQSKSIASSEGDSLKSQSKFLLSSILGPRTHYRYDRLAAMKAADVTYYNVVAFAHTFRIHNHQECFFYGNLTPQQADALSTIVLEARLGFLEDLARANELQVQSNSHLEAWFLNNPVERIVMLEKVLMSKFPLEHTTPMTNGSAVRVANTDEDQTEIGHPELSNRDEPVRESFIANQEVKLNPTANQVGYLFLVHNEIQSSSCVLFFLQFQENVPKNYAMLEFFLHLVRVKLINRMKYVVSLGYVVGCDIRRMNNTLGFRIIVESQYPLALVHDTIEKSLADLEEYLECLDEESLAMSREALVTSKEECNRRMRDKASNLWKEIIDTTYNFKRLTQEIVALRGIDIQEMLTFYRTWIAQGGSERRCLILSIGPDPILNCLDSVEGLSLVQVPDQVYATCDMFCPPDQATIMAWYQLVFDSREGEYSPPNIDPLTFSLCDSHAP